jgi:hypothetical protein
VNSSTPLSVLERFDLIAKKEKNLGVREKRIVDSKRKLYKQVDLILEG